MSEYFDLMMNAPPNNNDCIYTESGEGNIENDMLEDYSNYVVKKEDNQQTEFFSLLGKRISFQNFENSELDNILKVRKKN